MRLSTPFFDAFGPLLFGRARRSQIASLTGQDQEQRCLGSVASAFSRFIPEDLMAKSATGVNSRNRLFSPMVTFWAFLAQVLERGSSCRDAVRRVAAWFELRFPGQQAPSLDTSAYCQARARLEDEVLEKIGTHLADQMHRNTPASALWKGRRVRIIDGTTVCLADTALALWVAFGKLSPLRFGSMPDTPANQAMWPQPKSQKPGCGFPLLKLVGLFCLQSGALLRTATSNLRQHESVLARTLHKFLDSGDLLLADRGFSSFLDISELAKKGVDCLMRLHQMRSTDFRKGTHLGSSDRLITWTKPARAARVWSREQFDALPATLTVRMLRFCTQTPGFRSQQVVLVTTLLDPKLYPLETLAELYFQRWGVELHFREIKTLLGMDILRCLSPKMILKELAMQRIAYNLVRSLMQQAAISHHVPLGRLSFKGSLDSLHHFADVIAACSGKARKQTHLRNQLLLTIAFDPVPLRPDRVEPRAKKRRPKNYHLLTRPRHEMVVPNHRNRPKPALS
jgi:DDE family transposase